METIKFTKLRDHVYTPIRQKHYVGDAGWDLAISEDCTIAPGDTVMLPTGVVVELPEGYFARITNRSSTRIAFGVTVNEGIIDNGWRGELFISAHNFLSVAAVLHSGQRIAQMLIHKLHDFKLEEVQSVSSGVRGTRGFGSTGKK